MEQKIKIKNAHLVNDYEILQLKTRQRFGKPRKLISKFKETILDAVSCARARKKIRRRHLFGVARNYQLFGAKN